MLGIKEKAMAAGSKVASGAGKVAGGLKKLYLNPRLTGIQTAMLTGALGLAQGDAATAIQSARAGGKAGDVLGAHMSEADKNRQIRRNEAMFERAYDNYQIANPDADMKAITAQILSGQMDKDMPEGMRAYAAIAKGLKETYDVAGMGNSSDAVQAKIDELKKYE